MENLKSLCSSLWSFILFLPFFSALLLLGILKGIILCPIIGTIMAIGNSSVILGLWPAHSLWTFYCIARSKLLGPVLKTVVFFGVALILIIWPLVGITGSLVGGFGYGFFSPLMATFEAVGEGKRDKFKHCFLDGTWSTVRGSCTVVRDVSDVCFYSYFSIMDDIRLRSPPDGQRCEISIIYLMASILVGLSGIMIDVVGISLIAMVKSPYMLLKGWQRLFHDLIGREGPFLETACVPFAGLAIILWPAAVIGALALSLLSSSLLGGYATIITYQERSVTMGMRYIIASLAMYDEYSNDILDMGEGSCLPRLGYRKGQSLSRRVTFFSRDSSLKPSASRSGSFKNSVLELNPLKLLEHLFSECETYGEELITKGLITEEELKDYSKAGKSGVVRVGLPACTILRSLLRSAAAESEGILLSDNTEITLGNKPQDTFFDWFLEPLIIIKEQIRVEKLTVEEEEYLCRLVLFVGDSVGVKVLSSRCPVVLSVTRQGELEAIARRLKGITRAISRYPTYKRQIDGLARSLEQKLTAKISSESRSSGGMAQIFSNACYLEPPVPDGSQCADVNQDWRSTEDDLVPMKPQRHKVEKSFFHSVSPRKTPPLMERQKAFSDEVPISVILAVAHATLATGLSSITFI